MRISDWSSDVCSSDLDRHRSHRERPTGPEQSVGNDRQDRGVEAYFRRQSREHRIGEALRDQHDRDDAGCHEIVRQRGAAIGSAPLENGKIAGEAWPHRRTSRPSVERSEEPTSELQLLMRISYALFTLTK